MHRLMELPDFAAMKAHVVAMVKSGAVQLLVPFGEAPAPEAAACLSWGECTPLPWVRSACPWAAAYVNGATGATLSSCGCWQCALRCTPPLALALCAAGAGPRHALRSTDPWVQRAHHELCINQRGIHIFTGAPLPAPPRLLACWGLPCLCLACWLGTWPTPGEFPGPAASSEATQHW